MVENLIVKSTSQLRAALCKIIPTPAAVITMRSPPFLVRPRQIQDDMRQAESAGSALDTLQTSSLRWYALSTSH
ncbi:hypothetical protein FJTKL_00313 [Diaporthe vaccinii]|uniref:Uncharacterized protein n=1 Tax=Diaporthe vaccinii TaxID=105482 RepID=A0ABR4E3J7_9PEZI